MDYKLWDNAQKPIGVVQIIHNRDKTPNQYENIARFLNKNRYLVWMDELYQNANESTLFDETVETEMKTLEWLKNHFALPVFIIGDGYGSFVTQKIIQNCQMCSAGVCMAGGGRYSRVMLMFMMAISWIGKKVLGNRTCPTFANKHKCRTFDFWFNLFKNLRTIKYNVMPNIPMLIIGGMQDMNSMNGRLARSLYNAYSKHDLHNLTLIIYPQAQKDLMLTPGDTDVYQDILAFINAANNAN